MTQNVGGTSGAGGASLTGPCDIYAAGNTPCVAAHSTVRALFGAYNGNLYQVRRASDKTTKDIAVLSPGGYANAATQDTFCASTTCTISVIYDQSSQANHLTVTPPGGWLANGGTEANATAAKITVGGHSVYGVYTTGSFDEAVGGVGYRNNKTKGRGYRRSTRRHVHGRQWKALQPVVLLRLRKRRDEQQGQRSRHHGDVVLRQQHAMGARQR